MIGLKGGMAGGETSVANGTSGWGPPPTGAASASGWGAPPPPNPSASAAWGAPQTGLGSKSPQQGKLIFKLTFFVQLSILSKWTAFLFDFLSNCVNAT